MPRLRFSLRGLQDLDRLRRFLQQKDPQAARRAATAISEGLGILEQQPRVGRRVQGLPDNYREWSIGFGRSGYLARYRIDDDEVVVLAIRHLREANF